MDAVFFCLNPLHCGAVVASVAKVYYSRRRNGCLNPLHCGAVVASAARNASPPPHERSQSPSLRGSGRFPRMRPQAAAFAGLVSIPFIAGQWSLRAKQEAAARKAAESQSPSLRGSGRFTAVGLDWSRFDSTVSQSPSLRGSGRFELRRISLEVGRRVSIPFIAGQWSLRTARSTPTSSPATSQSPSLRGSGRFQAARAPSRKKIESLNPLHCGAVVASPVKPSGQPSTSLASQSPSLRGSGRF